LVHRFPVGSLSGECASAEYKLANPDNKNVAEVGRAAGVAWKALGEEAKEAFNKQATALKAKFELDHPEVRWPCAFDLRPRYLCTRTWLNRIH
jgi:hypothetical protein